jgi:cystathionine beta-synthase
LGIISPVLHQVRRYSESVSDLVGDTPIVRLTKVSEGLKPTVLAKLEFLNPGGSVKDRIGLPMILDAESKGLLKKGGTIVEPTSGNTGVGLAIAAAVRGYKMVFTMPDKMSEEKRRLLEAYGAKVIVTPTAVPIDDSRSYMSVARKIAKESPNTFMPNQYYNPINPKAHFETTGKEIWEQTGGRVDVFVAGIGTGGTITGVAKRLKEMKSSVKVVGVDPEGSIFADVFYERKPNPHPYKTEGIGEDFMPSTLDLKVVDEVITVKDSEAFIMARKLARQEGMLVGSSSGAAMAGALKYAKKNDFEYMMVVLLPDRGERYLSKFYSDEWMSQNGLPLE